MVGVEVRPIASVTLSDGRGPGKARIPADTVGDCPARMFA